ncbi:MAG TPA: hypothetical protein VK816_09910 [Jatrophihabitantaceae bacterium]|jgi:hypothetical protein|nr:hypothetical protein [Jatrophihabitantaceae bacterium]
MSRTHDDVDVTDAAHRATAGRCQRLRRRLLGLAVLAGIVVVLRRKLAAGPPEPPVAYSPPATQTPPVEPAPEPSVAEPSADPTPESTTTAPGAKPGPPRGGKQSAPDNGKHTK